MKLSQAFYAFLLMNNDNKEYSYKISILSGLSSEVSLVEANNGQGALFGSSATPGCGLNTPNATNQVISQSLEKS